ncbi:hypothetical protein N431DRAFT_448921 [Stipitochalara longipes BDJ]|nr:hypothetical protein N431DRAFT_448921 [Stipitochalara longipes BDJ]
MRLMQLTDFHAMMPNKEEDVHRQTVWCFFPLLLKSGVECFLPPVCQLEHLIPAILSSLAVSALAPSRRAACHFRYGTEVSSRPAATANVTRVPSPVAVRAVVCREQYHCCYPPDLTATILTVLRSGRGRLIRTISALLFAIWRVERLRLLATDRTRGFSSSRSGYRAASALTLYAGCWPTRLVGEPLAQGAASPGIAQGSHKPVDTQQVPGSLTWVVEVWWKGQGSGELQQRQARTGEADREQTGSSQRGETGVASHSSAQRAEVWQQQQRTSTSSTSTSTSKQKQHQQAAALRTAKRARSRLSFSRSSNCQQQRHQHQHTRRPHLRSFALLPSPAQPQIDDGPAIAFTHSPISSTARVEFSSQPLLCPLIAQSQRRRQRKIRRRSSRPSRPAESRIGCGRK